MTKYAPWIIWGQLFILAIPILAQPPATPQLRKSDEKNVPDEFHRLMDTAYKSVKENQPQIAVEQIQLALALAESNKSEFPSLWEQALDAAAKIHFSCRDYKKAATILRRLYEYRKNKYGQNHWSVLEASARSEFAARCAQLPDSQKEQLLLAEALTEKAAKFVNENKLPAAIDAGKEAAQWYESLFGSKNLWYADCLSSTAWAYYLNEDYKNAEPLYLQAIAIERQLLGNQHPSLAITINNLALLYGDSGQYSKAESLYIEALAIKKLAVGEKSSTYCTTIGNLATIYQAQGKFAQAMPILQQVVSIEKEILGENNPDYATSLHNLGLVYSELGQYERAESVYLQAYEIRRATLGESSPMVAKSLNNLGTLYYTTGEVRKAEDCLLRSLEIKKKTSGTQNTSHATALHNLAYLYTAMGEFHKAEPRFLEAMAIERKVLGENHPSYATSLHNLALLYESVGEYAKAEPRYRQAAAIRLVQLGENHPSYANSLSGLALLYERQGNSVQAEKLHLQALAIRERVYGKSHPEYAKSLFGLGVYYYHENQWPKAEPLFNQALLIRRKFLGDRHVDVGHTLNGLAALYRIQADYAKAELYYQQAGEIIQRNVGTQHPDFAAHCNNLALFALDRGHIIDAERQALTSFTTREKALGASHPDLAQSLNTIARIRAAQGQWDLAVSAADRAQTILHRHLRDSLPAYSEFEQQLFLERRFQPTLDLALSLTWRSPEYAEKSAEWLLNAKGIGYESLAERSALYSHPANAEKLLRLRLLRQQLANWTLKPQTKSNSTQRERLIERLSSSESELSKSLGIDQLGIQPKLNWTTIQTVRSKLTEHQVLVEIARFRPFAFEAKASRQYRQPARYVAWIIPPLKTGTVVAVDLGLAEDIDTAILAYRAAIANAPARIAEFGEQRAFDELYPILHKLSRAIIEPIYQKLKGFSHWIISPDGDLWLLPMEVLFSPNQKSSNEFVVEKQQVSYCLSGRMFFGSTTAAAKTDLNDPLVIADPDFTTPPHTPTLKSDPTITTAVIEVSQQRGPDARSGEKIPVWRPLPGTRAEAQALAPRLQTYSNRSVRIHLGSEATETRVKSSPRPMILVLATHGFVLADRSQSSVTNSAENDFTFMGTCSPHPLLRCGLAFAGANVSGFIDQNNITSKNAQRLDDGIMTGMEIALCDLRGTELVILSACDTALGMVHTGQGVAGLRQCFQIAGAKGVIGTLWSINDFATVSFMEIFWREMVERGHASAAITAAQRTTILQLRKEQGVAHPFYWGAFTYTGVVK